MNEMQDATFKMQTVQPAATGKAVAFAFCILHFALLASGCAKTQAASVPDGPPLAVPAAPARVLSPPAEEPLAENPPEPQPAATPPEAPSDDDYACRGAEADRDTSAACGIDRSSSGPPGASSGRGRRASNP